MLNKRDKFTHLSFVNYLVYLRGLEPLAHSLGNYRSIHLSYRYILERMRGLEPPYEAWEAPILPLNYIRIYGTPSETRTRTSLRTIASKATVSTISPQGYIIFGTGGGTRTPTPLEQQILSLSCLPFHHTSTLKFLVQMGGLEPPRAFLHPGF